MNVEDCLKVPGITAEDRAWLRTNLRLTGIDPCPTEAEVRECVLLEHELQAINDKIERASRYGLDFSELRHRRAVIFERFRQLMDNI